MKGPEAKLKDEVKAWLKSLNAYTYMPVPAGYGAQTLDFLCCINGRFVGIETKAEGKVPTPRQEACMRAIREAGGVAVWGDSLEAIKGAVQVQFAASTNLLLPSMLGRT
jgi:hypothetical protein